MKSGEAFAVGGASEEKLNNFIEIVVRFGFSVGLLFSAYVKPKRYACFCIALRNSTRLCMAYIPLSNTS